MQGGDHALAGAFIPVRGRRFIELLITTFIDAITSGIRAITSGDFRPIFQRGCVVRCYICGWQELLLREPPTMSGREFWALLRLHPQP
jgi:hypothetical protein